MPIYIYIPTQTLNPISSIVQSAFTAGFHFSKSVTAMLYSFAISGHPSPFFTMYHFLHCATTPVWIGVGVALIPSVSEGELATGVVENCVRAMVIAVEDRLDVGAVELMLSELGGLLLALLLEVLPSLTQYRKPFLRTQSEGLSLLYDRDGFSLVKSSTFTTDAVLSYVLSTEKMEERRLLTAVEIRQIAASVRIRGVRVGRDVLIVLCAGSTRTGCYGEDDWRCRTGACRCIIGRWESPERGCGTVRYIFSCYGRPGANQLPVSKDFGRK